MTHRRPSLAVAALLALALAVPALAQGERLTLDWIFSDEGKSAAAVPDHAWLDTGQAILYDDRLPKAERTLESLDPVTGTRTRLVDPEKVLAAMTAILHPDEPPEEPLEEIGWPDALDPQGRWAAYEKGGSILLLDLRTSEVTRVGRQGEEAASPRFSPDGARLAFVRENDLFVRELASGDEKRLTEDGSATLLNGTVSWVYWEEIFGRVDMGYWWAPDSASIAYLQTDESGVGVAHFVDFKPNLPRVVEQRYPKAGEANPRVRAGVVSLESGKTTWVDLGAYPYEYLARVKWLPDGKGLAVQTLDRSQTKLDLFLADPATGSARHLMRETDDGWVNLHDDLVFLESRPEFLWVSERDDYAHFYLYGMDGKVIRQVTRGPWPLRASASVFWHRQAAAHLDEEGGWLYFTALEKAPTEIHLYRIRLDGTGMERLTRADGTHRIAFRPDGGYYLDSHSAIDRMPSLTLHRADGKELREVSPSRPETMARFELGRRELFTIPAADGFSMPAMLLRPRGFDPARRYPVVLYVYGGPSAPTVSNSWGGRARDYDEQILADEGYAVLRVDNRSATAQSKRLENLILEQGYGSVELDDLLDAVKWLKSQPWVDPERVGIWGWSGGGSFTLLAMTSSKEFRAGVAVAAVSDWRYYDSRWAEAFMKRPQDNPEGYDRTSHAQRAKDLHGRLLLVHGTYDDNVHPQNAWRFADELIEAGIPFDMMIYPMRKHGISDDAAQKHLYATMLEFWNRSLR